MTVIPGSKAGFWAPHREASSLAATSEAMTHGSGLEYYITDRNKAMWDPDNAVVIYDGGTPITPSRIDYAGGYVTLQSTPSGAVTADCYYYALEALCGAYGVSASLKAETKDTTLFSNTLNSAAAWKEYVATLQSWTMNVKRHFFFARASVTTALSGDDNDLTWTWRENGVGGNAESIQYESGGSLAVSRAGHVTTVTYVATTTTAANVKAAIEADPTLNALWELSYPSGNDGSGVVDDVAEVAATGGRDSVEISRLGEKVLCVMYLDIMTGEIAKLEGIGHMTGFTPECQLENLVESDISFEGTGALRFHTV